MKKVPIRFRLNGVDRDLEVAAADTLLEVLRDGLGIKSPKTGCDHGDCGACTVFLDDRTVRSCLVLAAEADGCDVVTLEGISRDPGPLLHELARHNSFQCGFCAPGVVLSAAELLRSKPHPTRQEIQEAIAGNLCRCTGYTPIIEGIEAASCADSCLNEASTRRRP
ncbi:MAG: (2Fe-2S)-binding protein [Bryobacteraceae bacterium]|jgi:carbon-monoxide dehydrogenase small subunit